MKKLENRKVLSREQLKTIAGGTLGVCRLANGGYVMRDCNLKCPGGGYPICPA
ncbi:hypothetical protein N0B40_05830 [Chryseobacterium oranimense]|uniref:hypothetical protein n=1 Tax=Chryseobacterium oranimense TaxID=421058 RepID=UPI0021B03C2B|nr:hypothetical protein [Chryseobacterium oranimense]UWX61799.1 hypothetical protein N0B40_05830 [Chryseobacterium oranimense]